MTDPAEIIHRTRTLCKAATPGLPELIIRDDGAGDFADFKHLSDVHLHIAAPELMMELVEALERSLGNCERHKHMMAQAQDSQHRAVMQTVDTVRLLDESRAECKRLREEAFYREDGSRPRRGFGTKS